MGGLIVKAYINGSTWGENGEYSCAFTQSVEIKEKPLGWQEKGLLYTATGYGSRIPTRYIVKFNGKWRRVYCRIYSNSGTLFIGQLKPVGERLIVRIDSEG
jgi:hypothetical protein